MNVKPRDASPVNMRVEMQNGAWRVWWIDFKLARVACDEECRGSDNYAFRNRFSELKQNMRALRSKQESDTNWAK